jgi:hypothetical protein
MEFTISSVRLPIPNGVELEGESLLYWAENPLGPVADHTVLEDFVDLAEASDETIRDFAGRWGMLHLCEHGLPAGHVRADTKNGCLEVIHTEAESALERVYQESVGDWRRYARRARGLVRVSMNLMSGTGGDAEGWRDVAGMPQGVEPMTWWKSEASMDPLQPCDEFGLLQALVAGDPKTVPLPKRVAFLPEAQSGFVVGYINRWVRLKRISPELGWEAGELGRVEFKADLFATIGLQLMRLAGNPHGLATCASCGRIFVPETRRAAAGRRSFCSRCGRLAENRLVHREARKRARDDRQLRLIEFMKQRSPQESWEERLRAWNEIVPEPWRFGRVGWLRRAVEEAYRELEVSPTASDSRSRP